MLEIHFEQAETLNTCIYPLICGLIPKTIEKIEAPDA